MSAPGKTASRTRARRRTTSRRTWPVSRGVAGAKPRPEPGAGGTDGKALFASAGCGSCHTLADAGSSGTVGPNLDDAKPNEALVVQMVTNGGGAMPPFKDRLSEAQIAAVAKYVSGAAGK